MFIQEEIAEKGRYDVLVAGGGLAGVAAAVAAARAGKRALLIEKSMKLTYDIDHAARLIDVDEYRINGYNMLYGFIAGILAGNYDIVEVYLDGVLKLGNHDLDGLGTLLDELAVLTGDSIKMVVTVSANMDALPESVKKYL